MPTQLTLKLNKHIEYFKVDPYIYFTMIIYSEAHHIEHLCYYMLGKNLLPLGSSNNTGVILLDIASACYYFYIF